MLVYLRRNRFVQSASAVTLRDGYQPVVGCTSPHLPGTNQQLELEPAIWFKTLIIDSIVVDCDRREVRWNRNQSSAHTEPDDCASFSFAQRRDSFQASSVFAESLLSLNNFVQHSYDLFEDGECYDYDSQKDELFDKAITLLTNKKQMSMKEFDTELLRLLHCYILPAIRIKKEDVHLLKGAYDYVTTYLSRIEENILKKDKSVVLIEGSFGKQRDRLVMEFQSMNNVRIASTEFLLVLLKDIEKDIESKQPLHNALDFEVNKMKLSNADETQLESKRIERDSVYSSLERFMMAREHIKNYVSRPSERKRFRLSKRPPRNVFHDIYQEIHVRLLKEKEEMQKLIERKVKIYTVREAINLSIKELQTQDETFGIEVRKGGSELSTDILGSVPKPREWMTLSEKVGELLMFKSKSLNKKYKTFCQQVIDRIQAAIETNIVFKPISRNSTVDEGSLLSTIDKKKTSQFYGSSTSSDGQSVNIENLSGQDLKEIILKLRDDVNEHMGDICNHMKESYLKEYSLEKIRICYEVPFYSEVLESLLQMYKLMYGSICKNLGRNISGMSLEILKVDDPWVVDLVQTVQRRRESLCEESSVKVPLGANDRVKERNYREAMELYSRLSSYSADRLSIPLNNCTLDELYKIADHDCQRLNQSLSSSRGAMSKIPDELDHYDSQSVSSTDSLEIDFDAIDVFVSADPKILDHGTTVTDQSEIPANSERAVEAASGLAVGESSVEQTPEVIDNEARTDHIVEHDVLLSANHLAESDTVNNAIQVEVTEGSDVSCSKDESINAEHVDPSNAETGNHNDNFKKDFKELFQPALKFIVKSSEATTVASMLKQLTRAYRFVSKRISDIRMTYGVNEDVVTCDDMLTASVVLLTYLEPEQISIFYATLNLMIDFIPTCLSGGVHDCTLTNFIAAFQFHIDTKLPVKRSRDQ